MDYKRTNFSKYLRADGDRTEDPPRRTLKKVNADSVRRDRAASNASKSSLASRGRRGKSSVISSQGPGDFQTVSSQQYGRTLAEYSNVGGRSMKRKVWQRNKPIHINSSKEEGKSDAASSPHLSGIIKQPHSAYTMPDSPSKTITATAPVSKPKAQVLFTYNTPRQDVKEPPSSEKKPTPGSGDCPEPLQTRNLSSGFRGRSLKKSKSLNQRSDSSKKSSKPPMNSEGKEKLASLLHNLLKPQGKAPHKKIDLRESEGKKIPRRSSDSNINASLQRGSSSLSRFQNQFKRRPHSRSPSKNGIISLKSMDLPQTPEMNLHAPKENYEEKLTQNKIRYQLKGGLHRQSERRQLASPAAFEEQQKYPQTEKKQIPLSQCSGSEDEAPGGGPPVEVIGQFFSAPPEKSRVKVMARFRPTNQIEQKMDEFNNKILQEMKSSNQMWDSNIIIKEKRILPKVSFDDENPSLVTIVDNLTTKKGGLTFSFDHIFRETADQAEVYRTTSQQVVADALRGYSSTIMAYGQTGSGKTYTMFGPDILNPMSMGIIPRVSIDIFEAIRTAIPKSDNDSEIEPTRPEDDSEFIVKVQMLEIYKEQFNDLLVFNQRDLQKLDHLDSSPIIGRDLKMKESVHRGTYIEGLTTLSVVSEDELLDILLLGERNRHVGQTKVNSHSSRSHSIFVIEIIQRYANDSVKRGVINMVDLAGSERVSKSFAQGESLQEAKKINQSLSTLGKVINCISRKTGHIPYRDSKLTRLLKESLGGNNKTTLIVNCSSHSSQIEETLSTLRFAQSAKQIENSVRMNLKFSRENFEVYQNRYLTNVIKTLKTELNATKMELTKLANSQRPSMIMADDTNKVTTFDLDLANESQDHLRLAKLDLSQFKGGKEALLQAKLDLQEYRFKVRDLESLVKKQQVEIDNLKTLNKELASQAQSSKIKAQELKLKQKKVTEESLRVDDLEFEKVELSVKVKELTEAIEMQQKAQVKLQSDFRRSHQELSEALSKSVESEWMKLSKLPKIKARVQHSTFLKEIFLSKAVDLPDSSQTVSHAVEGFKDLSEMKSFLSDAAVELSEDRLERMVLINQVLKLSLANQNFVREYQLLDLKLRQKEVETSNLKKHVEELNNFRKCQRKIISNLLSFSVDIKFFKDAQDKIEALQQGLVGEVPPLAPVSPGVSIREKRIVFQKRRQGGAGDAESALGEVHSPLAIIDPTNYTLQRRSKVFKSFSRKEVRQQKADDFEEIKEQVPVDIDHLHFDNLQTFGKKQALQQKKRASPSQGDDDFLFDQAHGLDSGVLNLRLKIPDPLMKGGSVPQSISNFDYESKITKNQNSKSGNSLLLSNFHILNELSSKPSPQLTSSLQGSIHRERIPSQDIKLDLQPTPSRQIIGKALTDKRVKPIDTGALKNPSQVIPLLQELQAALAQLQQNHQSKFEQLTAQNEYLESLTQQLQYQLVFQTADQVKEHEIMLTQQVRRVEAQFYKDLQGLKTWIKDHVNSAKEKIVQSVELIANSSQKKRSGEKIQKKKKAASKSRPKWAPSVFKDPPPQKRSGSTPALRMSQGDRNDNYNQYNIYKQHYVAQSSAKKEKIPVPPSQLGRPIEVINQSLVLKGKADPNQSLKTSFVEKTKIPNMPTESAQSEYYLKSVVKEEPSPNPQRKSNFAIFQVQHETMKKLRSENRSKSKTSQASSLGVKPIKHSTPLVNFRKNSKGRNQLRTAQMSKASDSSNGSLNDESVTVFGATGDNAGGIAQMPYFLQSNVSRRSLSRPGHSTMGRTSMASLKQPVLASRKK